MVLEHCTGCPHSEVMLLGALLVSQISSSAMYPAQIVQALPGVNTERPQGGSYALCRDNVPWPSPLYLSSNPHKERDPWSMRSMHLKHLRILIFICERVTL